MEGVALGQKKNPDNYRDEQRTPNEEGPRYCRANELPQSNSLVCKLFLTKGSRKARE
jgi:hypothetical protein